MSDGVEAMYDRIRDTADRQIGVEHLSDAYVLDRMDELMGLLQNMVHDRWRDDALTLRATELAAWCLVLVSKGGERG